MDFMMPEMNGWKATRILRATAEAKEIPIIALIRPSDVRRCIEAGCNDYLAKPFRVEELRKGSKLSFTKNCAAILRLSRLSTLRSRLFQSFQVFLQFFEFVLVESYFVLIALSK